LSLLQRSSLKNIRGQELGVSKANGRKWQRKRERESLSNAWERLRNVWGGFRESAWRAWRRNEKLYHVNGTCFQIVER